MMSRNFCPSCNAPLATEDINIQQGVGFCGGCGKLSRLTEIVDHAAAHAIVAEPPAGCSVEEYGDATTLCVATRSAKGIILTFAFGAFWNGIVSVFVLQVVAGFYNASGKPVPAWFPSMATSGAPTSWPDVIMLALFLIPFIVVGLGFMVYLLICATGVTSIRIHAEDSWVRSSVALISRTTRFDATQVSRITVGPIIRTGHVDNWQPWIRIDADRTIRFGMAMDAEAKAWLAAVLAAMLLPGKI